MNTARSKRSARRRPSVVLPAPGMPVISQASAMASIVPDGACARAEMTYEKQP